MARVLVVDDEVIIAMQLEACIQGLGHQLVGSAASGLEALDLAERLRPDIILMDIKMPGPMDGIEAAERIRRRFDIPVLLITAYAEDPLIERAKQAAPLGFIVKPFHGGEIRAAIEVAITRMELERRLRDHERRYQLATSAGRVGVWEWDPETERIYLEPILRTLLGRSGESDWCAFDQWLAWVHPDDRRRVQRQLQDQFSGSVPTLELERRLLHQDGRVFWFLARTQLIEDARTGGRHLVGTDVDITERKRMETALNKSRERFRSLLETTSDLIWELDRERHFTYLSPQIYQLLGYRPAELTGSSLFKLLNRSQVAVLREQLTRMAVAGRDAQRFETVLRHRDGSAVVIETSGVSFHDSAGRLLGFRGISRDVTERKRLRDALVEANLKLEQKVAERTRHLLEATRSLKLQGRELERRSEEAVATNESLREANVALMMMTKSMERGREERDKQQALLVRTRMKPLIQRLEAGNLEETAKTQLQALAGYLDGLAAGLSGGADLAARLSETEWKIALLIKDGLNSRAIAERLGLAVDTVKTHRKNIRRKLRLKNSSINLTTHLMTNLG